MYLDMLKLNKAIRTLNHILHCHAGGLKLQSFLGMFEIVGSAYFLAFPTIFVLVQAIVGLTVSCCNKCSALNMKSCRYA